MENEKAALPQAEGAHYTEANVTLVKVRHERILDGETDVVVRRERCAAANLAMNEVIEFIGFEPDWCLDVWRAARGEMISAIVCEDAARTAALGKGLAEYARQMAEAGKANEIPVMEDGELAREVAAKFDAEWTRMHAAEMDRLDKVLTAAKEDGAYLRRIVLGRWTPEAGDTGAAALNKRVSDVANATVTDGGMEYSLHYDAVTKDLIGAFGFPSKFDAKRFVNALGCAGLKAETLAAAEVGALCDCAKVTACHVLGKLMAKAKAAQAEG